MNFLEWQPYQSLCCLVLGSLDISYAGTRRELKEGGKNKIAVESFTRDAGRLWNRAPEKIKMAPSIVTAKVEIK